MAWERHDGVSHLVCALAYRTLATRRLDGHHWKTRTVRIDVYVVNFFKSSQNAFSEANQHAWVSIHSFLVFLLDLVNDMLKRVHLYVQ